MQCTLLDANLQIYKHAKHSLIVYKLPLSPHQTRVTEAPLNHGTRRGLIRTGKTILP